jgi:hypothetical protein
MSALTHRRHAEAAGPTLSLLRLSAAARLAGAALITAALWGAIAWAWS